MEQVQILSPFVRAFSRQLIAVALACVLPATVMAQETTALKLTVISGTGAVNDLRTNATVPTVVELRDDRDQPVLRGEVTFMLPESGPGGRFADGSRSLLVLTGRSGRAMLTGFIPNQLEGPFQIAVEATSSGNSVRTTIRQYNKSFPSQSAGTLVDPPVQVKRGSGTGGKILVTVLLGAAVAAGSILALKSRGNGNTPPTTTVSIGGINVGGPR